MLFMRPCGTTSARKYRIVCLLGVWLSLATSTHGQTPALLLFGGSDHKTFLGCLNCNKYEGGSVCDKYGEQGSKYSSASIWNTYGNFGSKYSSESPWMNTRRMGR
jgi:hypothetical protein